MGPLTDTVACVKKDYFYSEQFTPLAIYLYFTDRMKPHFFKLEKYFRRNFTLLGARRIFVKSGRGPGRLAV